MWLPCPSPGDLPNPGIEPRSPALQAASLPAKPPGKPKNTGVGSLSLPQWIFPTQESTRVSCIAGGFFTGWATGEPSINDSWFQIQKGNWKTVEHFILYTKLTYFPLSAWRELGCVAFGKLIPWLLSSVLVSVSPVSAHFLCLLWVYFAFHLDF